MPGMKTRVDVQYAIESASLPSEADIQGWASAAITGKGECVGNELVVRIVDELESETLNTTYRGKHSPTNVLSFPFEPPPQIECSLLGDVVICAPVVASEAVEQGKPERSHWAHMVVHGVLHLQGFDHQHDEEAAEMEFQEKTILAGLGYADPYL